MAPTRTQPLRSYSRSASSLAVSSTSSVLPALAASRSAACSKAAPRPWRRARVDQHLGEVAAMGLVIGLVEHDLRGTTDAVAIFGDQKDALAGVDVIGDATPERCWRDRAAADHEADRRAIRDAIRHHDRQGVDVSIGHAHQPSHCRNCHLSPMPSAFAVPADFQAETSHVKPGMEWLHDPRAIKRKLLLRARRKCARATTPSIAGGESVPAIPTHAVPAPTDRAEIAR